MIFLLTTAPYLKSLTKHIKPLSPNNDWARAPDDLSAQKANIKERVKHYDAMGLLQFDQTESKVRSILRKFERLWTNTNKITETLTFDNVQILNGHPHQ